MPPTIKYYFGRLNIVPIYPYEQKKEMILAALNSRVTVEDHRIIWRFFNASLLQDPDLGEFAHGYLGRYKPKEEVEIAKPESGIIDFETIDNLVSARSAFFLHIKSGIIAFHIVPKLITLGSFKNRFTGLLFYGLRGFFVDSEIDTVNEELKLTEQIQRFSRITQVDIRLHPSNPTNRDLWARQDARLKALRATSYWERIQAQGDKTPGLNVTDDSDIRGKIAMAEDGYGVASVRGEIEGQTHQIKTSDNPITVMAPGDPESPEYVFSILKPVFRRIFQRFTDEA